MSKLKKITVLLAPEIFAQFNEYCEENGYKKSSLLNRMIISHLEQNNSKDRKYESGKRKAANRK